MPDSRRLLVTTGEFAKGSLVLVDVAHAASSGRSRSTCRTPTRARVSPDGGTVAFSVSENGFDGIPTSGTRSCGWRGTSDGGDLRRLTVRSGNDHWPVAWAPDGQTMVWTADDTEGGADLYIARANGEDVRRLTSDPGYDAWPSSAPRP